MEPTSRHGNAIAEYSTIGCILLDYKKCKDAIEILLPEMFEHPDLAGIFTACQNLLKENKPIDVVTVLGKVGDDKKQIIAYCGETAVLIHRVREYAEIVRESWRLRRIQQELMDLSLRTTDQGVMVKDILPELEKTVEFQRNIENTIHEESAKVLKDCILEWLYDLQKPPSGLKTGHKLLDFLTGGLQRKGLYVLSARPGKGKTDFALDIAVRMSREYRVNYNTLEMPRVQCTERIISNLTRINSAHIRDRTITQEDRNMITQVTEILYHSPLVLDEQTAINAAEVKSKILKHRPDLIILDNLQLMGSVQQRKNKWEAIEDTTKMLKQIALQYNVVILLLVQESREADKGGAPTMSNLRGSSSIEADTDGVFFLRNEHTDDIISGDDYIETKLHIVKNRHGGTGVCPFHWQPQYHRYSAVDDRED